MYKKTHSNAIKIFTVLKNKYVFKIGRYIKIAIHNYTTYRTSFSELKILQDTY